MWEKSHENVGESHFSLEFCTRKSLFLISNERKQETTYCFMVAIGSICANAYPVVASRS